MSKLQVVSELWSFLRLEKKYWLAPLVLVLLLLGLVIIVAQGSNLAPFIYTLF